MRKRADKARSDISDDATLRLEFQFRNPNFRAEVDEINQMPNKSRKELLARQEANEKLKKKWKLDSFHFPITSAVTPEKNLIRSPVRRLSSDDGKLIVEVDLNQPAEDLLALFERLVSKIQAQRKLDLKSAQQLVGSAAKAPKRRHSDRERRQIEAYDAVIAHKTYRAAANQLHQQVRKVMNDFWTAWRKIYCRPFPGKRRAKWEQLRHGFDPKTHRQMCSECRTKGLCSVAWEYVNQVDGSRLGDTGRDLDYEASRPLRRENLFQSRDALDSVIDYRHERARKKVTTRPN